MELLKTLYDLLESYHLVFFGTLLLVALGWAIAKGLKSKVEPILRVLTALFLSLAVTYWIIGVVLRIFGSSG